MCTLTVERQMLSEALPAVGMYATIVCNRQSDDDYHSEKIAMQLSIIIDRVMLSSACCQ